MKSIKNMVLILLAVISATSVMTSCTKSETGTPSISYIRVTKPESADSLLIGAGQGQLIAIVGANLQDAEEIWFNDQQARLTPTYVSSNSILVSVPSQIPMTVTNKLKIVFKDGFVLYYDFQVQISKPVVSSMLCEFVNDGEVATIQGNYFYAPLTVTFTGGVTGTIVSVKDQQLQVQIPAGAKPGPVTVKTNFGETKSNFYFRDDRNHVIDSDPYEGWWNASYVVTNPGAGEPPKISGNYIHYKKFTAAWSWNEVAGGPASAMPNHSKNIPDAAILKPEDYNLKFEINTLKPYNAGIIRINIGLNAEDNNAYQWKPPFDSKGQWQTVTVPFEEVIASYAKKPTVDPAGYWTRLLIQGPGDWDADFCLDNFRVVPKVVK